MREQDEHHANANAQRLVVRCVRLYLWERVASKLGLSRRHPGDQWRHCVESHGLLYDLQRCKWKLKFAPVVLLLHVTLRCHVTCLIKVGEPVLQVVGGRHGAARPEAVDLRQQPGLDLRVAGDEVHCGREHA